MKKTLFFLISFLWANCSFAQVATITRNKATPAAPVINGFRCHAPVKLWEKHFGANFNEGLSSIVPTADGGYLLGGTSYSGISNDKTEASRGNDDFWILKTDADFNKVWDKRYGGSSTESLNFILPTSDGGYILSGDSESGISGDKTEASRGQSDFWIVKIDANGNKLWDKSFGGNRRDFLGGVYPVSDGGYLLIGSSESDISGDKTGVSRNLSDIEDDDCWIIKIDANGNKLWDKTYGGDLEDGLGAIIPTSDGGYLLGGYTNSTISGEVTVASKGSYDA